MAPSTTKLTAFVGGSVRNVNVSSIQSVWQTILTGVHTGAANPVNQVSDVPSTMTPFQLNGRGSTVLLRMGYPNGTTSQTTPLIVNAIGRSPSMVDAAKANNETLVFTDDPCILKNAGGNRDIQFDIDPDNDLDDGTYKYTDIVIASHAVDLWAHAELLLGIKQALDLNSTNEQSAFVQAKAI